MKIVKESINDELIVFRGQKMSFYDLNVKTGYNKPDGYNLLFVHTDINTVYLHYAMLHGDLAFCENFYREIVVFKIPNRIKKVTGRALDNIRSYINTFKQEGYVGVTSDIVEFSFDIGEIGLFYFPEPIERFQTRKGFFSKKDIDIMINKYGLNAKNALRYEKEVKDKLSAYPKGYYKHRKEVKW